MEFTRHCFYGVSANFLRTPYFSKVSFLQNCQLLMTSKIFKLIYSMLNNVIYFGMFVLTHPDTSLPLIFADFRHCADDIWLCFTAFSIVVIKAWLSVVNLAMHYFMFCI